MPRRPENVPNLLSATAIAHRSAAQYGQYSAPMYTTSGLLPEVSGVPVIGTTALGPVLPLPTAARVLAGTLVTSLITLAGRAVPVVPPACSFAGGFSDLKTIKDTTMTITPSTLPAVMNRRL